MFEELFRNAYHLVLHKHGEMLCALIISPTQLALPLFWLWSPSFLLICFLLRSGKVSWGGRLCRSQFEKARTACWCMSQREPSSDDDQSKSYFPRYFPRVDSSEHFFKEWEHHKFTMTAISSILMYMVTKSLCCLDTNLTCQVRACVPRTTIILRQTTSQNHITWVCTSFVMSL